MKILSLSTIQLLPYLGSGKTRIKWTQGLKELGHEVTVLQPSDFEFLPSLKKATQLKTAIGIFFTVNKLLKANKYDIVEFYGDQYWLLLFWLKKIRKIKSTFIAHVDGNELLDMDKAQIYFNQRKGWKKWVYTNTHRRFSEMTFALADKYVCGCPDDLDYVIDKGIFSINDVSCVSPGIDDLFHEMPFKKDKDKIIIFLGSWIDRKGVALIPEVITNVLSENLDYKFHIYGAWSSKDEILSLFSSKLTDRVIVHSKLSIEELHEEIIKSAILFFPSFSEGFGLGTAEAMSCSCAVVTTRTGLGSELINNKNALIVDFCDTTGMTDAINRLIVDENLRIDIAYNGYLKAKEFYWDKQVKLLEELYFNWMQSN